MQKEISNPIFVQGVNFEFLDLVKNNGTKYLFTFGSSCEENCNSKAFYGIATAGRYRGSSTIYFKHNLFHQSKLGWVVELQNTRIVLSKSPRDVMQVNTLGAQLCLISELVDWYRGATSVPNGQLLIDLSPRTDNRLRYCTNTASTALKIHVPERLKQSKSLEDEQKISHFLQLLQSFSHSCKVTSFSVVQWSLSAFVAKLKNFCSKEIYKAQKDVTWQNFKARFDYCL